MGTRRQTQVGRATLMSACLFGPSANKQRAPTEPLGLESSGARVLQEENQPSRPRAPTCRLHPPANQVGIPILQVVPIPAGLRRWTPGNSFSRNGIPTF